MFEKYGEFLVKERIWTMKNKKGSNRVFRFNNNYGVQILEWPENPDEYEIKVLVFTNGDKNFKEVEIDAINVKGTLFELERAENIMKDVMRL